MYEFVLVYWLFTLLIFEEGVEGWSVYASSRWYEFTKYIRIIHFYEEFQVSLPPVNHCRRLTRFESTSNLKTGTYLGKNQIFLV